MILDIILLLPIVYGLIRGVFRGLVGELTAIVAVIAGIICAKIFAPELATYILNVFTWNIQVCNLIAYLVIFLVVTCTLHLVSKLLARLLSAISLGWLNRLAGGLFGGLKWALIVSILLNCFNLLDNRFHILQPNVKKASVAYEPLEKLASVTWDAVEQLDTQL